jgi:hypothetical protein
MPVSSSVKIAAEDPSTAYSLLAEAASRASNGYHLSAVDGVRADTSHPWRIYLSSASHGAFFADSA